ncbi:MAG: ATP-binding protein [Deltaproteobacteria bacterium]|nr:ATP-binding protein [Deltaproteobacteria bacterium]
MLLGARQVGKTYALKEFGRTSFGQTHCVNFEEDERVGKTFERDLKPARIVNELQFLVDKAIDRQADLLILDEIQRCPRALTSLKYFAEEMPELAICAAGSLLGVTLADESFPVGKVTLARLRPMSFAEFLGGTGREQFLALLREHDLGGPFPETAHERLWEIWKHYVVVGGLPEVVGEYAKRKDDTYEAMKAVRKIQRDLLDTYMADIAKHSGKANAIHVERLWRNVPAQLARTQHGSAPKFRFRDAVPGLRGYGRLSGALDWLGRAELVIRVPVVDAVGTPLAGMEKENTFKLYFFDVGLLGLLGGIAPATMLEYGYGAYQGYVAENFVAQELRAADAGTLHCWQGRTAEVEFLVETGREVVPVEVKSGHITRSKSLGVFEERYNPAQSFVLSANNVSRKGKRRFLPLYAAGRLGRMLAGEP